MLNKNCILKKCISAALLLSLGVFSTFPASAIRTFKDIENKLTWIEVSTATVDSENDHSLLVLQSPISETYHFRHGSWETEDGYSLWNFWDKCKAPLLQRACMPVFGDVEFPSTDPFSPTTTEGKHCGDDNPLFILSYHDAIAYLSLKYEVVNPDDPYALTFTDNQNPWAAQCFKQLRLKGEHVWLRETWCIDREYGLELCPDGAAKRASTIDSQRNAIIPACWINNENIKWSHV
jgi:hypothetical protein